MKTKNLLILDCSNICLWRFRKELIIALKQNGWNIYVLSPNDGYKDELESLGIHYTNNPYARRSTNPIGDYMQYRRYKTFIKKIQPAIILTYTIKPNIYGNLAAKSAKTPVISTVTGLGDGFLRNRFLGLLIKFLYRISIKNASCIAIQNRENEEILRKEKIIKNQKVMQVTGSGVNLQEYKVMEYPDEETVSFLYMGRILKAKGIRQLIEAASRLKTEAPNTFTVTLIGYSEGDIQQIFEEAVKKGVIIYGGFTKDVTPYINKAHCIVLPSYYNEGLSNTLLEGAASGRPLITTDIAGCRDVVENGINGFICKPRDANSLYNCMKRFISLTHEEKKAMGQASRIKVEQCFNRDLVVQAMLDEINKLV